MQRSKQYKRPQQIEGGTQREMRFVFSAVKTDCCLRYKSFAFSTRIHDYAHIHPIFLIYIHEF